jgi:hypothetical protein
MPSPVRSATLGLVLALTLLVSGCGGSDDSGTAVDDTSSSAPSPGAGGGGPQPDPDQLQAIQECLEAAGLGSAVPTGIPSGMPTDLPSDLPTEMPTGMPTDMGSGFPGAGGGQFDDPQVRKALKACGIELPTAPNG